MERSTEELIASQREYINYNSGIPQSFKHDFREFVERYRRMASLLEEIMDDVGSLADKRRRAGRALRNLEL